MILIAAVADNGIIGAKNEIPWYLPEDLKRFKQLTLEHAVVMGRKTYESIILKLKKPLPGRLNLVVTNQRDFSPGKFDNAIAGDLPSALERAAAYRLDGIFYVMGGEQIYRQTMPQAQQLEITHVHQWPFGDAFFPKIDMEVWKEKETSREDKEGFSFVSYARRDGR